MLKQIDISYNPFVPLMKILIDGSEIDDFSQLISYINEPIWEIKNKFFDILYSEAGTEYIVNFEGTKFDAAIFEVFGNESKYCKKINVNVLRDKLTSQKRMIALNQYIKNKNINVEKQYINCLFVLNDMTEKYKEQLEDIEIQNIFCKFNYDFSDYNKVSLENKIRKADYVFLITEDEEFIQDNILEKYNETNIIAFVLKKGDSSVKKEKNILLHYVKNDLISDIFEFTLDGILPYVLGRCIENLGEQWKYKQELQRVTSIGGTLIYKGKKCIELGKSIQIVVEDEYGKDITRDLKYKVVDTRVASCQSLTILGNMPGKTKLEIYRRGEKKVTLIEDIEVISVNRVEKIILDNDYIEMGIGDRYTMKHHVYPEDADNIESCKWLSTDKNIVSIDMNGNILAKKSGQCEVICIIGNVSSKCGCIIKPYLDKILVNNLDAEKIVLESCSEFELEISLEPEDAIDNNIKITSLDYDIVNVIGRKLIGKNTGTTQIKISNGSVEEFITVKVVKKKNKFFNKLFNK